MPVDPNVKKFREYVNKFVNVDDNECAELYFSSIDALWNLAKIKVRANIYNTVEWANILTQLDKLRDTLSTVKLVRE